jgi:hypothetical protein
MTKPHYRTQLSGDIVGCEKPMLILALVLALVIEHHEQARASSNSPIRAQLKHSNKNAAQTLIRTHLKLSN